MKTLTASAAKIARNITPDLQPLKIPAFRSLYFAGIFPAIGASITFIVIQQQIYSATGRSSMIGIASIIMMVPIVVFGLTGGLIADKFDRRKVLLITTTGVGLSAAALGMVSIQSQPEVATIIAIACVQQAFFAVNQPTRQAIVPRIVPTADLPAANALLFSLFAVSILVGPLVGGILLTFVPIAVIYFIEAAVTLPMVVVIARLPSIKPVKQRGSQERGHKSTNPRLWTPLVRNVLLLDLLVTVGAQPRALFPSMAIQEFGSSASPGLVLGLLNSAAALGFLLGITTGKWLRNIKHLGKTLLIASALGGLILIGLSLTTNLSIALGCLIMLGGATMISATCRNTILQSALHDSVRGRAQGLLTVVTASGPRLADLLHGTAADAMSTQSAILIGAAITLIAVFLAGLRSKRLLRWSASESTHEDKATPRHSGTVRTPAPKAN